MSQARGNNHERCVYQANYHYYQLGLLMGKDGSQENMYASDLFHSMGK